MLRVVLRQLVTLVVAVVIALVLLGLLFLAQGRSAADAFLVEGPNLLFVFMDIGLGVCALLLVVGAVRKQGLGWGVSGTILAAVVGALANLIVITAIVLRGADTDLVAITIGAEAGGAFVLGMIVATVLVARLIPIPETAGAESSPPAS